MRYKSYKYKILGVIIGIMFYSCSLSQLSVENKNEPLNIDVINKKWLIDESIITGLENSYDSKIFELYQKFLHKELKAEVRHVSYFGLSTVKNAVSRNLAVLGYYKEKTKFDYLVETKIQLVKNDMPRFMISSNSTKNLSKEIRIEIDVYDFNTSKLILKKEYTYIQSFVGTDPNFVVAKKLKRFTDDAIKETAKRIAEKYNWNKKDAFFQ